MLNFILPVFKHNLRASLVAQLEKEMATHSSILAWKIQGPGEPGGLPSMGLHRVGHDWSDSAAAAAGGSAVKNLPAKQETQVQSLGHKDPLEEEMATHSSILSRIIPWTEDTGGPWSCKELDMTEWLKQQHTII